MGAGILGLPGAYAGSGIIPGTALLVIAAFFSANGLRLLSISATTVSQREQREQELTTSQMFGSFSDSGVVDDNRDDNNDFKRKPSSFYTVAHAAVPAFTILIDAAVALKCFGVATSYLITVGDCMVDAMTFILGIATTQNYDSGIVKLLTSRHFWVTFGTVSVLPISFFKTLNSLRYASTLGLILIYGLVVLVVLFAHGVFDPCEGIPGVGASRNDGDFDAKASPVFSNMTAIDDCQDDWWFKDSILFHSEASAPCQGDIEWVTSIHSTLKNMPIFVFSFTCHQNIFPIVNEIKNHTQRRIDTVISLAIFSTMCVYLIVAIEGYRTYGSNVKSDILLNYPETVPVTIMRIFITVMIVVSYPLQLDPSRRSLTSIVKQISAYYQKRRKKENKETSIDTVPMSSLIVPLIGDNKLDTEVANETDFENVQDNDESTTCTTSPSTIFYTITITFILLSFTIAMSVSDLGKVLSVVGATGSTIVSYILPGAIYVKLHPGFHFLKVLAWLQLVLGCLIALTALFFIFTDGGAVA